MIETKERTELATPPDIRREPEGRTRRRTRGWWGLIAAAFVVAVAAGVIIVLTITGPTTPRPNPADRGHSRFHQLPELVPATDGSKVDLSDQAFRYGLVKLGGQTPKAHTPAPPPLAPRFGPR